MHPDFVGRHPRQPLDTLLLVALKFYETTGWIENSFPFYRSSKKLHFKISITQFLPFNSCRVRETGFEGRHDSCRNTCRRNINTTATARIIATTMSALIDSNLPALTLISKGKVRDIYSTSSPDHLLFVASDRISAYDVILRNVCLSG